MQRVFLENCESDLAVEAFDVHVEVRYAICPADQRSSNVSRLEEKSAGGKCKRRRSNTRCASAMALRALKANWSAPMACAARYRGKRKAGLQNYLIGAACNIRRLFRRHAWETVQAHGAESAAMPAVAG